MEAYKQEFIDFYAHMVLTYERRFARCVCTQSKTYRPEAGAV